MEQVQYDNIYDKLYHDKIKKERNSVMYTGMKEVYELQGCTFKPVINSDRRNTK